MPQFTIQDLAQNYPNENELSLHRDFPTWHEYVAIKKCCNSKTRKLAITSQRLPHLARLWAEQAAADGEKGTRGFHFFKLISKPNSIFPYLQKKHLFQSFYHFFKHTPRLYQSFQTAAMMEMILDHPWALSASFHTGTI